MEKYNMQQLAEAYERTEDQIGMLSQEDIKLLKDFTLYLYLHYSTKNVTFIFQKSEPYDYLNNGFEDMLEDYLNHRYIRIGTGGDESELLGDTNLMFRATHDFIHVLSGLTFSFEDEIKTFEVTRDLFTIYCSNKYLPLNELVIKTLFSEIVLQSAQKNIFKSNDIKQKIILDWKI